MLPTHSPSFPITNILGRCTKGLRAQITPRSKCSLTSCITLCLVFVILLSSGHSSPPWVCYYKKSDYERMDKLVVKPKEAGEVFMVGDFLGRDIFEDCF